MITRVSRDSAGRNDPCPCGSGLKYKRCHLLQREGALRAAETIHDRDRELRWEMSAWAAEVLQIPPLPVDPDDPMGHFMLPMHLYHVDFGGTTIAKEFVDTFRHDLTSEELQWLEAQMAGWISIWEIENVEPGWSMNIRDLLTGETRTVLERTGSMVCRPLAYIVARVVDFEGTAYLAGTHPGTLPPFLGEQAVELVRRRLRIKHRTSPRRLRAWRGAIAVVEAWDEVLDALAAAFETGPQLVTTEGDPILGVTDRYAIEDGDEGGVRECIRAIPGVEMISDALAIVFRGDSILANIDIEARRLRVETHSMRRADEVRATLEEACGQRIRHQSRAILDPLSEKAQEEAMSRPLQPLSDHEAALARAYKEKHYATWIDEPIPMLDGQTPRAAMRSAEGRRTLDLLLRDMEYREQEVDPRERLDIRSLREKLGLTDRDRR